MSAAGETLDHPESELDQPEHERERALMLEALMLTRAALERVGKTPDERLAEPPDIDLERRLMGEALEMIRRIRRLKP